MTVYWPGIILCLVAVGAGVALWYWLLPKPAETETSTEALEQALARTLPYDVTADNWLEASHYLAWLEKLPETEERAA